MLAHKLGQVAQRFRNNPRLAATVFAALGQGSSLLISPILSRIYTPADFGIFAIYMAGFNIFSVFLTMRYEQALYYETYTKGARALVWGTILSVITCVMLIELGWLLTPAVVAARYGFTTMIVNLSLLGAVMASLQRVCMVILARAKLFGAIAKQNAVRPLGLSLLQLLAGWLSSSSLMMMLGHVAGQVFAIGYATLASPRLLSYLRWPGLRAIGRYCWKHRHFPLFNTTQNLFYVAGDVIVPILITRAFSANEVGLFWMAFRVSMLPQQLFVESARVIICRDVAQHLRVGDAPERYVLLSGIKLSAIFLIGAVGAALLGQPVFALIFGAKWALSGAVAPWLLLASAMSAFAVPFVAAVPLVNRQSAYMVVEVIALIGKGLSLTWGGHYGFLTAVKFYVASGIITYGLFYAYIWLRLYRGGHRASPEAAG